MNTLFERAVAVTLERKLLRVDPRLAVHVQHQGRYLAKIIGSDGNAFALRPDLVISESEMPIAIADTKWRLLDVDRAGHLVPSRVDVYQMLSYAAAFGVNRVVLVYPTHSATSGIQETTYVLPATASGEVILHVTCVDVDHDDLPFVAGSTAFESLPAT